MPTFLHPCPHCNRHIRCDEVTCPFCSQGVCSESATTCCTLTPRRSSLRRMSRAALMALGTAATGSALASCGDVSVAIYGAPPSGDGGAFYGTGGSASNGTGGKTVGGGGTSNTGGDSFQPVYGASPTSGGAFNSSGGRDSGGGSDTGGGDMGGMGGATASEDDSGD